MIVRLSLENINGKDLPRLASLLQERGLRVSYHQHDDGETRFNTTGDLALITIALVDFEIGEGELKLNNDQLSLF